MGLNNRVFLPSSALQEAQEIFGVDFDYDEFEKYNEYDEEMEEEYEYEDEETEGETRVRPKKTTKKRVSRRSIFEMYEPSELESSHLTDQDNEIRMTDMPERFQVREGAAALQAQSILAPRPETCRLASCWVGFGISFSFFDDPTCQMYRVKLRSGISVAWELLNLCESGFSSSYSFRVATGCQCCTAEVQGLGSAERALCWMMLGIP